MLKWLKQIFGFVYIQIKKTCRTNCTLHTVILWAYQSQIIILRILFLFISPKGLRTRSSTTPGTVLVCSVLDSLVAFGCV